MEVELELATLPQILEEMSARGLPFIFIANTGSGLWLNYNPNVKPATVMKGLNYIIGNYLDYCENVLEEND